MNSRRPLLISTLCHNILQDYAAKAWGGLVRDYYKPRWQLYLDTAMATLKPAAKPFDGVKFRQQLLETIEEPWSNATNAFPTAPEHDAVALSTSLCSKYLG
jgi:alpha-N-acetylglucosaminidase